MKAKIVAISSGSQFVDGEQRITLRIEQADSMFNEIRIKRSEFSPAQEKLDIKLDQEFEYFRWGNLLLESVSESI